MIGACTFGWRANSDTLQGDDQKKTMRRTRAFSFDGRAVTLAAVAQIHVRNVMHDA